MDTITAPVKKPAAAPSSDAVAKARQVLEDLLNSAPLGVTATGTIEFAEEPSLISGVSSKGRAYSFWNRRITLKVNRNGQTVNIAQSRDKETDFPPLDMNGVATFKIASARMDGPVMVLREEGPER